MVGSIHTGIFPSGSGRPDDDNELKSKKTDSSESTPSTQEDDEFGEGSVLEAHENAGIQAKEIKQEGIKLTQTAERIEAQGERNIEVSQSAAVLGTETIERLNREIGELKEVAPAVSPAALKEAEFKEQIAVAEKRVQVLSEIIEDLTQQRGELTHLLKDKIIFHEGKIVQLHENNLDLAKIWKTHGGLLTQDGKWQFKVQEHIDQIKAGNLKFVGADGVEREIDHRLLLDLPPEGEARQEHMRRFQQAEAQLDRLIEIHQHITTLTNERQVLQNRLLFLRNQLSTFQQQTQAELSESNKQAVKPQAAQPKPLTQRVVTQTTREETEKTPIPTPNDKHFTASLSRILENMAKEGTMAAHSWKTLMSKEREEIEEKHRQMDKTRDKKDELYYQTISDQIAHDQEVVSALCYEYNHIFNQNEDNPKLISLSREMFHIHAENLGRVVLLAAA